MLSFASLIHHRFCPCHFPITITPRRGEWLLSREQNANGSRSSRMCTLHSAVSDVLVSYELIRLNLPAPGWLNRCLVNNRTAVTVQLTCDTQRVLHNDATAAAFSHTLYTYTYLICYIVQNKAIACHKLKKWSPPKNIPYIYKHFRKYAKNSSYKDGSYITAQVMATNVLLRNDPTVSQTLGMEQMLSQLIKSIRDQSQTKQATTTRQLFRWFYITTQHWSFLSGAAMS